jgi:hypothetical protein
VQLGGAVDVGDAILGVQDDEAVAEPIEDLSDLAVLAYDVAIRIVRNGASPWGQQSGVDVEPTRAAGTRPFRIRGDAGAGVWLDHIQRVSA